MLARAIGVRVIATPLIVIEDMPSARQSSALVMHAEVR